MLSVVSVDYRITFLTTGLSTPGQLRCLCSIGSEEAFPLSSISLRITNKKFCVEDNLHNWEAKVSSTPILKSEDNKNAFVDLIQQSALSRLYLIMVQRTMHFEITN